MTEATTRQCPLCQKTDLFVAQTGIREDPERPVYGCNSCGLQFIDPPSYDLCEYYRTIYRSTHSNQAGTQLTPQQNFDVMRPLMDKRVELFREHVPKGAKVLEIGCSSGYFLDAIRDDYTVYGNEWNPTDAAFVRDELGIPCSEETLERTYLGETFTVICAFHVIEHVPDPIAWLNLIKSRLIGGGWIYLETPNLEGALVSIYDSPEHRNFWYKEPHLTYFNMDNFAQALGSVGFEAQVRLRQEYSMWNHINWLITGEPMPNRQQAQRAYGPVDPGHPAATLINRLFSSFDRQYRGTLDTLKACDTLIALGRKREI